MQTYLPSPETRAAWRRAAENARSAPFWRELPPLPERPDDGHKGTFGTALAIGGSRGMSGAIGLAGAAANVVGAGLTRLVVPDPILETVASFWREYTLIPGAADASGKFSEGALGAILDAATNATAVAVGPGLGRSAALDALVVELFFELDRPAIFDADALNALASSGIIAAKSPRRPKAPRIFTPHPGEFGRLVGSKPPADAEGRAAVAQAFAQTLENRFFPTATPADAPNFVVVLKGRGTIVAAGREF
ncbi:MAG: NAD(P)H-hydrate dehydratase [Thermoguttaceae bacterium]|nr:NAD(P)H-hydrate dehydratase [Thermoguttaceae bacterium]